MDYWTFKQKQTARDKRMNEVNIQVTATYGSKWDINNNCGPRPGGLYYPFPPNDGPSKPQTPAECDVIPGAMYLPGYKCAAPCKANPDKIVRLFCDCYVKVMSFAVVKPCEWAYEDFETCDEVEDNNDWECDPRSRDCGGIYEWGPFEKELEGTTDFPTTTAASEASDEKWEQLGDLIEIAANNSLTEKSSTSSTTTTTTTKLITTTTIKTTTVKMTSTTKTPIEKLTTAPTTPKTAPTTTPEPTTAIETTTITLQAEKNQENSENEPVEKEKSKIQYLKDSLEDSPGLGQFLISMGKPGESGSVINSFHISPVMTNNVETHNNGGESSKFEHSKFEAEPYTSGPSYDSHFDHEVFQPNYDPSSRKLRSPYPHMMEDDIHATLNSIQRELMSMREENFNLSKKLMREKLKSKHIRQHKNQSSEENL